VIARRTNEAVLRLLEHRHTFSSSFQEFCRTRDFLEPLAQALCLIHDEKLQQLTENIKNPMQEMRQAGPESKYVNSGGVLNVSGNTPSEDFNRDDDEDFMAWPTAEGPITAHPDDQPVQRTKRRGSLAEINSNSECFAGKSVENESNGIGMVQLLHLVLSHAVLSDPLSAALISALFHSFPIHDNTDQVEAFHLVLIEH